MIIRRIQSTEALPLTQEARQKYGETISAHIRGVVEDTPELAHPNQSEWIEHYYSTNVIMEVFDDNVILAGFDNDKLVATGFLDLNTHFLWGLYIQKEYRGKGYGTEMFNRLFSYAPTDEVKGALYSVNIPSMALVKKMGFIVDPEAQKNDFFPEWDLYFIRKKIK